MSGRDKNTKHYSPQSKRAGELRPGEKLLCSTEINWHSVLLQVYRQPGSVEEFVTTPSPDHLLVLVLHGTYEIESLSNGRWKRADYRPGVGGLTAPMTTNRLRWQSRLETNLKILRLYLPQQYFDEAYETYRKAGDRSPARAPDALSFDDPVVFAVAASMVQGVTDCLPDLYADAAAQFLAAHLLTKLNGWSKDRVTKRPENILTDARMLRVLDFMRDHCSESLSISQLAREAAVSHFHFAHLFKAKVGSTPYKHLVHLRMVKARTLLSGTALSVAAVAAACGYLHGGHFAAAFLKESGLGPVAYRNNSSRSKIAGSGQA